MKIRFILLLVFLIGALGLLGWRQGWFDAQKSGSASGTNVAENPVLTGVVGQVGEFQDPVLEEIAAFEKETLAMLGKADYDALEKRAEMALKEQQLFRNGDWKLDHFYDALGSGLRKEAKDWAAREKALEAWLVAKPASVTAHIARADFYTSYGWDARGFGYADTVTNEGWRLLRERLTQADTILKQVESPAPRDPHYWRVYQTVALGLDWAPAEHDRIFERGVAVNPGYFPLYFGQANHLLQRWGGQPGEFEKFVMDATKIPGGPGVEVYARLAWKFDNYHEHLFRDTGLQWAVAKEGFEALRKRYPEAVDILSHYAILSTRGNDPATARRLFLELGNRLDVRTWSKQDKYLYYRRYAH